MEAPDVAAFVVTLDGVIAGWGDGVAVLLGYRADEVIGRDVSMFLPGEQSTRSYAEVATRLGRSEDAVKMAVSRLRRDYGQLLRSEIERTLSNPGSAEEELRCLFAALSG